MELEGWKSEAMIFDRLIHNPHACHRNGRAYRRALAQVVRNKAGNAFSTVGNNEAAEGEGGGGERREKGERERKKKEGEVEDFSRGGGFSPIRFACWSRVFRAISKFEGKDSGGT